MRPDQLTNQFVRLPRTLVTDGAWARLWRADRGTSTSLVPVMALLARGFENAGRTVHALGLAAMAGVPNKSLHRARLSLLHTDIVRLLPSGRRGWWKIRLGEAATVHRRVPSFTFPGALVGSRLWSDDIDARERSVLFALAAVARECRRRDWESGNAEVSAWLEEIESFEELRHEQFVAHRVGRVDIAQLSGLTGLTDLQVTAAIQRLGENESGVFLDSCNADGHWFHLPGDWWRVDGSVAQSPF